MQKILIILIDLYQAALSQFMGHCCRFNPTCSEYAKEMIAQKGACRGSWIALRRVVRCHPFSAKDSGPEEERQGIQELSQENRSP